VFINLETIASFTRHERLTFRLVLEEIANLGYYDLERDKQRLQKRWKCKRSIASLIDKGALQHQEEITTARKTPDNLDIVCIRWPDRLTLSNTLIEL